MTFGILYKKMDGRKRPLGRNLSFVSYWQKYSSLLYFWLLIWDKQCATYVHSCQLRGGKVSLISESFFFTLPQISKNVSNQSPVHLKKRSSGKWFGTFFRRFELKWKTLEIKPTINNAINNCTYMLKNVTTLLCDSNKQNFNYVQVVVVFFLVWWKNIRRS